MIKNYEFKKLRDYKEIIKQSEKQNFFDRYSIMRNLVNNISKGKDYLFERLGYDDSEKLAHLFEEMPNIEIISDNEFNLGNSNTNIWLMFQVEDDGSFYFKGTKQPLSYGRKYC